MGLTTRRLDALWINTNDHCQKSSWTEKTTLTGETTKRFLTSKFLSLAPCHVKSFSLSIFSQTYTFKVAGWTRLDQQRTFNTHSPTHTVLVHNNLHILAYTPNGKPWLYLPIKVSLRFCMCVTKYGRVSLWGKGQRKTEPRPNRSYSRYSPSLHALKDWWDKNNVTWFLRRQTNNKICQCKKSRSSLFNLANRKWRTFYLKANYRWKWSLLLFTFSDRKCPHCKL